MPVREVIDIFIVREPKAPSPDEIAAASLASADPFDIEPDCLNPFGHHFIADCSEVVCIHCARIAWQ